MVTEKQKLNLRPFEKGRSREEAVRNGRKGGVASGKARRLKGVIKKIAQIACDCDAPEQVNDLLNKKFGTNFKFSNGAAMVFAQIGKAINGDTVAFKAIAQLDGSFDGDEKDKTPTINLVVSEETKAILERAKREGID